MNDSPVIFVHGIWMPAVSMQVLCRRLRSGFGYAGSLFGYASVRGTIDENAALLADLVAEYRDRPPHIVAHSLGGVLAVRMLARDKALRIGRIVCLGSPFAGSRAGHSLVRHRWGRAIVGRSLPGAVLDSPASSWASGVAEQVEMGVIAGTQALGAGRLLARFDDANDGTVAVSETRLPGLRDHLCLPVSHTGLLWSAEVARQVAAFLQYGRFERRTA